MKKLRCSFDWLMGHHFTVRVCLYMEDFLYVQAFTSEFIRRMVGWTSLEKWILQRMRILWMKERGGVADWYLWFVTALVLLLLCQLQTRKVASSTKVLQSLNINLAILQTVPRAITAMQLAKRRDVRSAKREMWLIIYTVSTDLTCSDSFSDLQPYEHFGRGALIIYIHLSVPFPDLQLYFGRDALIIYMTISLSFFLSFFLSFLHV